LTGERTLLGALNRLRSGLPVDDLPNTARLVENSYVFGPRVDDHIDEDYRIIEWNELQENVFSTGVIPMQASNGCPYRCAFCNFTKDRRLTFVKPIDELMKELKAVADRGIKYVWFVDDNLRLGRDDLGAVCQRMISEEIPIRWMSFIRAGALESIEPEKLVKSGCVEVQLGLESADETILRNMNKQASPKQYETVIRNLLGAGINCSCYFIFGFPGETTESINRTIEFIKRIEPSHVDGTLSWSIFPFMLIPLSPVYEPESREKYNLRGYLHDWKHETMDSKQARIYALKAFLELENSFPIYRQDNQEMLAALSVDQRKRFYCSRNQLAKLAIERRLEPEEFVAAFRDIFNPGEE
jgi:p-methyltransferase